MKRSMKYLIALFVFPIVCAADIGIDKCFHDCHISPTGLALIKAAEGYSPFIYKDAVGVPTVGFGHAIKRGEHIKTPLLGNAAVDLLLKDVAARTGALNGMIERPLTASQFDALTSFAYNVGLANLERSTLLKRVNESEDTKVHPQFLLWDHAGGEVLPGLRVRREEEAKLYDEGIGK